MNKKATRLTSVYTFRGVLLLCAIAFSYLLPAQAAAPHQYDNDRWEELHRELDYSGTPTPPPELKEKESKSPPEPTPSRDWDFSFGEEWSMLMKILLFTLLGVLLVFLIRGYVQNSEKRFLPEEGAASDSEEESDTPLSLEELVEQLDTTEVDPYIREAENRQQYDLAVRLHFLASLKALDQHSYIRWKKDRTNRVYLQQLYGQAPYAEFRELSRIFEHCWYGRNLPDANTYSRLKERYTAFIQDLSPQTSADGR